MERFKAKNIFLVVIIGTIVLAAFTKEIGFELLISRLATVSIAIFLLVIVFNFLNLLAFTMTWWYFTPRNISFFKLFKFYMAGTFINNITPTIGTGGEPIKAMLLGRETKTSKAECFAGVVSQRMLNMFPFLTIGGLGIGLLFSEPDIKLNTLQLIALIFSIGLTFSIFGLIIYFYIRKDKLSTFVHSSIKFFAPFIGLVKKGFDQRAYSDAVEESINSFHGGLKNIHHNKDGIIKATLFSFLGWVFDILAIYAVFLSLGKTDIHLSILIITYTISMMSSWLPLFSPGGLGIVEGTMGALFILSGIPKDIAGAAVLLYRFVNYYLNTLVGGFYFWLESKPR